MFWTSRSRASILLVVEAYRRDVGARLKALRQARNWSQEDAAHEVGVTSATWGRWERGITGPYEKNWKAIARVFGEDEARAARGQPPTPLALGSNGNGHAEPAADPRVGELLELVAGMGERLEQLQLSHARAAANAAAALKRIEEGLPPKRRSRQPPPQ
jgi:transcriptional regulator with XRE-family HTH domain